MWISTVIALLSRILAPLLAAAAIVTLLSLFAA